MTKKEDERTAKLVDEAEVQSLVSFVFRGFQVFLLLLLAHLAPDSLPLLVLASVEEDGGNEQDHGEGVDANQDGVTLSVIWLVVGSVDV